jgi:hypothetical protein
MFTMDVEIVLDEEMLGTASSDPGIHEEYIASKAPDAASMEEEVAALGVDAVVAKGKTIFPRLDNGVPFLWDYQIKGFFKDACGMLSRIKDSESKKKPEVGTKSSKLVAFKKVIDGLIFPTPRKIAIVLPKGGEIGDCQRPLRAQTAQGERVALANSETVPEGSIIRFKIKYLKADLEPVIHEWLEYGSLRGLGQWRNSGKGRFSYRVIGK